MARKTWLRLASSAVMSILPLVAAGVSAHFLARDAMELASAAIAVAAALALASLIQMSALARETQSLTERQEDMRSQALALARCMKDFNARLAIVEADRPKRRLPLPIAVVDGPPCPVPPGAEPMPPEPPVVEPLRPEPVRKIEARRMALLSGASPWGVEIAAADDEGEDADGALRDRICKVLSALTDSEGHVLVRTGLAPSAAPQALALARALAAADGGFADRFVLGFAQSAVAGAGEAERVAQLARARVKMALTEIVDARLDGTALRACHFVCVVAGAAGALPAQDGPGSADRLVDLARQLATAGVDLICDEADAVSRVVHVPPSAAEAAIARPQVELPLAIIPWRALPTPQAHPRRAFSGLLSKAV